MFFESGEEKVKKLRNIPKNREKTGEINEKDEKCRKGRRNSCFFINIKQQEMEGWAKMFFEIIVR